MPRKKKQICNEEVQKDKIECEACGDKFTSMRKLNDHISSVHDGNLSEYCFFKCTVCSESFKSKDELRRHNGTHLKKEKCEWCHKDVAFIYNHKRKCKKYLQSNDVSHCKKCNRVFKSPIALKSHSRNCNTKCLVCDKVFSTTETLKRHLAVHDPDGAKFDCKVCDKKYYVRWELEDHMHTHMPEAECPDCHELVPGGYHPKYCKVRKEQRKKQSHCCPECGMLIKGSAYHLQRHIEGVHKGLRRPGKNEAQYECSECKLQFFYKKDANAHVETCGVSNQTIEDSIDEMDEVEEMMDNTEEHAELSKILEESHNDISTKGETNGEPKPVEIIIYGNANTAASDAQNMKYECNVPIIIWPENLEAHDISYRNDAPRSNETGDLGETDEKYRTNVQESSENEIMFNTEVTESEQDNLSKDEGNLEMNASNDIESMAGEENTLIIRFDESMEEKDQFEEFDVDQDPMSNEELEDTVDIAVDLV